MATTRLAAAAVVALGLTACGGGGGGAPGTSVDCAWLTSADNCWPDVAAAAHACVDQGLDGTFQGAGHTSCLYPDGVSIQFAADAFASIDFDGPPFDYTVRTAGGATCARYVETEASMALTTSLGTFSVSYGGTIQNVVATITCPDGGLHRLDDVLSCDLSDLPGWVASSSPIVDPTTMTMSLLQGPASDPSFFTCNVPSP